MSDDCTDAVVEILRDVAPHIGDEAATRYFAEKIIRTVALYLSTESALAAAARQGGDVQQAPGEAPQSGAKRNAPEQSA